MRSLLLPVMVGLSTAACFVDRASIGPPGQEDGGGQPPRVDASMPDGALPDAPPPDAVAPPDAPPPDAGPRFCDPSDPLLILCLRCEDEVRDESGADQTLAATEVSFDDGAVGRGCRLAASSRLTTSAPVLTQLTLETFVRLDALPAASARIGIADRDSSFGLFVYAGGLLRCTGGGATIEAPGALASSGWHHVACTIGAPSASLYVDGVPVGSAPSMGASPGSDNLHLGSNAPDGADALVGVLDELRIHAGIRPASAIAEAAARH